MLETNDKNHQLEVFSMEPDHSLEVKPARREPRKPFLPKGIVPSFLAGALVIGGLMFASDQMNLFTPNEVYTNAPAGTSTVQTVSLDIQSGGSIADIAEQASPAVVRIGAQVQAASGGMRMNDPFNRNSSGGGLQSDALVESGLGTGFIFDPEGYILTNEHVINGADRIEVTIQGYDQPFTATLVGSSYDLDLAILKIEGEGSFPSLTLGESDNMKIGEWVVAIGNPYDLDYTVTSGVVSAKERSFSISDDQGTRNYQHLFQTDTAINPGNSGGPLLNMKGEVIGINTAVSSDAQGIGFAIPTSTVKSVMEQLMNNEQIPVPYIGINLQPLTSDMLSELKLSSTEGVLVTYVQPGTPAAGGGLRQYDVIIQANDKAVAEAEDLTATIQLSKVGDKLELVVMRDGHEQSLTVTIGDKHSGAIVG